MKKKDLRRYYKDMRSELNQKQINTMDDLMLIQFQKLPIDIPSLIMTYAPMEKLKEFNPQLITDYCYFKNPNQQLLYPLMYEVDNETEMIAVLVNDETLFEKNEFEIDEPVDGLDVEPSAIDMVIVPLLCFNTNGYRVGYGKGYYDRFLKHCRPDCIKIGFSYFDPVEQIEDVNEFDVQLDYCITHERIYEF
ncbi:MAG: 5-formyltetrahydrofolate cyclo-ligase [Chitinophagaceae bacterium]|nr:5-formyltetrahydrofolate cyclo-ligase [Chitinophagaceae bacterium]